MERPAEIDNIISKLENLIKKKGMDLDISPFHVLIPNDLNKLVEYIRKLERGY